MELLAFFAGFWMNNENFQRPFLEIDGSKDGISYSKKVEITFHQIL